MNLENRHGVKVTVSPLLNTGEQRRAVSVSPYLRGERKTAILSDRTLVFTEQATGILPQNTGVTEQIYLRGVSTDVATVLVPRPTQHRRSRRRMKIASRIAYRRATVKRTPLWVPWICAILGFVVLTGVLYWFATTYLEYLQYHRNAC